MNHLESREMQYTGEVFSCFVKLLDTLTYIGRFHIQSLHLGAFFHHYNNTNSNNLLLGYSRMFVKKGKLAA